MGELKPCPDCGGRMKIDYKFHPLRYAVVHVSKFYWTDICYGGTDYEFQSETEAIEAWNRRASDDESGSDQACAKFTDNVRIY